VNTAFANMSSFARRDIVVVGASLGGTEALREILPRLPSNLEAALLVALHIGTYAPRELPVMLGKGVSLPISFANDGEDWNTGRIYVAPPDHHLEIGTTKVRLTRGPKLNHWRPAIDALFLSAARAHGCRVIGVILTGMLDDGVVGLNAIKVHGGVALVQEPSDALAPDMPLAALQNVSVDRCVPLSEIADTIIEYVRAPVTGIEEPQSVHGEDSMKALKPDEMIESYGLPSPYICPQCKGPLWIQKTGPLSLHCHVGHSYAPEALLSANEADLEMSLWSAVRALEEQASLLRRVAARLREDESYLQRARTKEQQAQSIRVLLTPSRAPVRLGSLETQR
jgi:two-component system, chemotaxis family, protein-glutamate methylesterase/glutaminase